MVALSALAALHSLNTISKVLHILLKTCLW